VARRLNHSGIDLGSHNFRRERCKVLSKLHSLSPLRLHVANLHVRQSVLRGDGRGDGGTEFAGEGLHEHSGHRRLARSGQSALRRLVVAP